MVSRFLLLRFEVDERCTLTGDELLDLAERIVAEQVDPDPPVLTYDGADVVEEHRD